MILLSSKAKLVSSKLEDWISFLTVEEVVDHLVEVVQHFQVMEEEWPKLKVLVGDCP